MNSLIDENREALERSCREHGVARLELFSSAESDEFDLETSDLDFLVEFHSDPPGGPFRAYFSLKWGAGSAFWTSYGLGGIGSHEKPFFHPSDE